MKNNWFRISSIIVLFTLLNQALSYAQTTPSATIEGDTAVCEKGEIHLKIKFQGKSPFGFIYKNQKGDQWIRTKPIFENQLVDGFFIETLGVSQTDQFELVEFFDGNMPLGDWVSGKGYKTVSGGADIRVDRTPVPKAGGNVIECGYSYALQALPQEASNETFWDDVVNGNFNDPTNPNALFTAYTAGNHILTFNEKSGTCIGQDQVQITLQGSPTSTISGETTICSTDGNEYTLPIIVSLEGTGPFKYTISNGTDYNELFSNQPAGIKTFEIPVTGKSEYKLIKLSDINNCTANDEGMTGIGIVNDNKPNTFAGDDAVVCGDPKNYQLRGSNNPHEVRSWSTGTEAITFDEINNNTTKISTSEYGRYTITWSETNLGCTATDKIELKFNPKPTLTLSQSEVNICEGSSTNMQFTTEAATYSYPLYLEYTFDTSNRTVSVDPSTTSIDLEPTNTTDYYLTKLKDTDGCSSDITDKFSVVVHSVPVANAGDDKSDCSNTVQLEAQITDGNRGFWSSEFNFFNDSTNPQSTFTLPPDYNQKATEDFELTWTEINGQNKNCTDQKSITITLDQQPEGIKAIKDTTLYHNVNSVLVHGLSKNNMHEEMNTIWESESTGIKISNPSFTETTISDIEKGSHVLIWKVENGTCAVVTDSITIIYTGLKAPNGFSPDGDGINDVFRIGGSEQINNHEFIVFNINGEVVYSTTKLTPQGWDGVGFDGPLQDGTYYYIFKGDGINPIKEYLVIKSK